MTRRGSSRAVCEHTFVCGGATSVPRRSSGLACRATAKRRLCGIRRAGGGRHPFLRGSGEVDPEPRAGGVADAVPVDDQSVPRLHSRLPILRWGETPVLTADGRHKPIADLDVGEPIYGTLWANPDTAVTRGRRCWISGSRSSPHTG